ncbi:MAG: superoxide dismutase [Myxococcota bacterium]
MAFTLPDLPYSKDALEPSISSKTLEFHHGKHHAGYVKKLNAAVEGTKFAEMDLEELVESVDQAPEAKKTAIFNNGCQHFNHSFYWKCMSPNGGGEPTGELAKAIEATFGGFAEFKEAFTNESKTHFGSGWGWLIKDTDGKLKVVSTHDADTPLAHGKTPLLTVDVWEHAYYLDYQNARPEYLKAFWNLVNWDFVAENFGK